MKLQNLFNWVASHDHHTELHADHIILVEILQNKDGSTETERHEIRTLKEAKEALGY